MAQENVDFYDKDQICQIRRHYTKGCLFLFNYFIDIRPTLVSLFFVKKKVFEGKKHVFWTKNGLIRVGLMSIK